jgi:hypothetical protein
MQYETQACDFIHQNCNTTRPATEPGSVWLVASDWPPELWHGLFSSVNISVTVTYKIEERRNQPILFYYHKLSDQ